MDFFESMFDFNGDGKVDLSDDLDLIMLTETISEHAQDDDCTHTKPHPTRKGDGLYRTLKGTTPFASRSLQIPERLTWEEYRERRRSFVEICLLVSMIALLACCVPGVIMWAAISVYEPNNGASLFVTTVFVLAGLVFIGIILTGAGSAIRDDYRNLQKAKAVYLKTVSEENNQST